MNILLLGGGGREHALAWKISQSKACSALFIGPGNAGTSAFGRNLPLDPTDFQAVGKACLENEIEMVVVGPEEPLVKGIVDYFSADKTIQPYSGDRSLCFGCTDWKEARLFQNSSC